MRNWETKPRECSCWSSVAFLRYASRIGPPLRSMTSLRERRVPGTDEQRSGVGIERVRTKDTPHPRPRHPSKKPSVCSTVFETCACAQVPWCTLSIEFNVLESGWHWCPRGAERPVRQWTCVVCWLWRWVLEFRQPRRLKTRRTTDQVPRSLMNVTSQTLPPMYKTLHFFLGLFLALDGSPSGWQKPVSRTGQCSGRRAPRQALGTYLKVKSREIKSMYLWP